MGYQKIVNSLQYCDSETVSGKIFRAFSWRAKRKFLSLMFKILENPILLFDINTKQKKLKIKN